MVEAARLPTLTIEIPRPHANQARIVHESSRFNVVNCGRRWGKTVMGINRAILKRKGSGGFPGWLVRSRVQAAGQVWRDLPHPDLTWRPRMSRTNGLN